MVHYNNKYSGSSSDEWGSGKKKNARFGTSKSVISSDEDDEDEEIYSDKNQSFTHAESDMSEDDFATDEEEFDDGYDENLMGGSDDREQLMKMTEVAREQELMNRLERREALKTRLEIKRRLQRERKRQHTSQNNNDFKSAKRTTKTSLALDELKKLRNKKNKLSNDQLNDNKEQKHTKKLLNVSNTFDSDDDDDGEIEDDDDDLEDDLIANSDEEFNDTLKKSNMIPIKTKQELQKLQVTRYKLVKWVFMPFFKEKMVGLFIKFSMGATKSTRYRIGEIKEIVEQEKSYQLEGQTMDRYLKVQTGVDIKLMRIDYVSNAPFTDTEFESWMRIMECNNISPPSLFDLKVKIDDLQYCYDFNPSELDIDLIVKEKIKFRKQPINYTKAKIQILTEAKEALLKGDVDKSNELKQKAAELEREATEQANERHQHLENIQKINERNRLKNAFELERALEEEYKEFISNKTDDPFTRRRTNPVILQHNILKSMNLENLAKTDKQNPTDPKPTTIQLDDTKTDAKTVDNLKSNDSSSDCDDNIKDYLDDLKTLYSFPLDIDIEIDPNFKIDEKDFVI